ncbi:MAG: hypothetical protein U0528_13910 [Anaerolineae bacterium]
MATLVGRRIGRYILTDILESGSGFSICQRQVGSRHGVAVHVIEISWRDANAKLPDDWWTRF